MGFFDRFLTLFSADNDSGETLVSLKEREAELVVKIEKAEQKIRAVWSSINKSGHGSNDGLKEKARKAELEKGYLEQDLAHVRYEIKQFGRKKSVA